jgi:hypothetical protein
VITAVGVTVADAGGKVGVGDAVGVGGEVGIMVGVGVWAAAGSANPNIKLAAKTMCRARFIEIP